MFSKLIFNGAWYEIIICFGTALTFALLLYFRNRKTKEIPRRILYLNVFLRFFSTFFLAVLLLSILLKHSLNETQKPVIILAVDNSASMIFGKDSLTQRENLTRLSTDLQKKIAEDFEVQTMLFGGESNSANRKPQFNEKETDIDGLIRDIENNYSNLNVGAAVLISDGIYNKGSNPLNNVEKIPFPVYSIACGDTTEITDVSIQRISHNDFSYLGNVFPVQVSVKAKRLAGKEIMASVYEGKTKKAEQVFKITSDNFYSTLTFTLSAEKGGIHRYNVNLSRTEGESNLNNNSRTFVIEVIDHRSKILLAASAPHPDISAIKETLLDNSSFETVVHTGNEKTPSFKAFSLVVLHGYGAGLPQMIAECTANNIPFWIINPSNSENLPGVKISASGNRFNDAEPVLQKNFGLFTVTSELSKILEDYPAVKTFFGNYSVISGANILLTQKIGVVETENPMFYFNELNGQKSAVFLGDGLWKWKLRNFSEMKNTLAFNELINKTVQFLSVKSDKSFFRVSAPKTVNENEQIDLSAEVYNKSFELISEPDVTLNLTSADKKQYNYTFSKTGKSYKLNIGFLPPGDYQWQAKVKMGSDLLTKSGMIMVKEIVAENINTVADHHLLYQIAQRTGGKFYTEKNAGSIAADLQKNETIKPITFTSTNTIPLIEYKWIFIFTCLILAAEWFLRKRYSTI